MACKTFEVLLVLIKQSQQDIDNIEAKLEELSATDIQYKSLNAKLKSKKNMMQDLIRVLKINKYIKKEEASSNFGLDNGLYQEVHKFRFSKSSSIELLIPEKASLPSVLLRSKSDGAVLDDKHLKALCQSLEELKKTDETTTRTLNAELDRLYRKLENAQAELLDEQRKLEALNRIEDYSTRCVEQQKILSTINSKGKEIDKIKGNMTRCENLKNTVDSERDCGIMNSVQLYLTRTKSFGDVL